MMTTNVPLSRTLATYDHHHRHHITILTKYSVYHIFYQLYHSLLI